MSLFYEFRARHCAMNLIFFSHFVCGLEIHKSFLLLSVAIIHNSQFVEIIKRIQ